MVAVAYGLFPPPETDSMHPWFLLWYLFLGLCGCKSCLAEGLENLHNLDFFLFFYPPNRKGEEAGKDLVILCQPGVNLSTEPPILPCVFSGSPWWMEEASVPRWVCLLEVPGAGSGKRRSSCCPADQGLLVLLAKVSVGWIWGCFVAVESNVSQCYCWHCFPCPVFPAVLCIAIEAAFGSCLLAEHVKAS